MKKEPDAIHHQTAARRSPQRAASDPQIGPLDRPDSRSDTDPAEALLHALIAECHQIIRDDVMPTARAAQEFDRSRYYQSVVDLVGIATGAVDAIARLRGGATPELRQRITVERVQTTQPLIPPPPPAKTRG